MIRLSAHWITWGLLCQKYVSRAMISNCIPQILRDIITYPCLNTYFWHTNPHIQLELFPTNMHNVFFHDLFCCDYTFTFLGFLVINFLYSSNLLRWQWGNCVIASLRWVMHICVGNLIIIGSDNGLLLGWHQAIIWTDARILFFWTPRNKHQWNFNQNAYNLIQENPFKMSSGKWQPFCPNNLWTSVPEAWISSYIP